MNLATSISKTGQEILSGKIFKNLKDMMKDSIQLISVDLSIHLCVLYCHRWKGENVSTSEVEAVVSNASGYRDVVVYGVEVCKRFFMKVL